MVRSSHPFTHLLELVHHPLRRCDSQLFKEHPGCSVIQLIRFFITVHSHQCINLYGLPLVKRINLHRRIRQFQNRIVFLLFFLIFTQTAEGFRIFFFVMDTVHNHPVFAGLHRKKFSLIQTARLLPQFHLLRFLFRLFPFPDQFHETHHIQICFHRTSPVKNTFFFYDIIVLRQPCLDQHLAQTEHGDTQVISHICQFLSSKQIIQQLCSGDSTVSLILCQAGMQQDLQQFYCLGCRVSFERDWLIAIGYGESSQHIHFEFR